MKVGRLQLGFDTWNIAGPGHRMEVAGMTKYFEDQSAYVEWEGL
jgi:hypothetical protein